MLAHEAHDGAGVSSGVNRRADGDELKTLELERRARVSRIDDLGGVALRRERCCDTTGDLLRLPFSSCEHNQDVCHGDLQACGAFCAGQSESASTPTHSK